MSLRILYNIYIVYYSIILYKVVDDRPHAQTLRAGDLVQTERRYLYTPKRIVCLISRPQWALNDSAAAAVIRSLPRLMTAVQRCGPFNVYVCYILLRVRQPPMTRSAPEDIVSSDFSLRCAPLLCIIYSTHIIYYYYTHVVVDIVNRPINVTT
ncbi:unnamed protein product [Aphis gossypii]|uniref:Uncharacterized protein n=1 Tax=Aphis gossypii TaxID=80765 RepID=A0A9P0IQZ6_APHGO|nr:unnamed protein product [Aphis gossypii]